MTSATTQQAPARETRSRHGHRHRKSLSRIQPATWRKIGAYVLVYGIAIYVCWSL